MPVREQCILGEMCISRYYWRAFLVLLLYYIIIFKLPMQNVPGVRFAMRNVYDSAYAVDEIGILML